MLFQAQNADGDITDFVPGFHNGELDFSKYKKIKDLELIGTDLKATDEDGFKWRIVSLYNKQFNLSQISEDFYFDRDVPFDIVKHISFEDKL